MDAFLAAAVIDSPGLLVLVLDSRGKPCFANKTFLNLMAMPADATGPQLAGAQILTPARRARLVKFAQKHRQSARSLRTDLAVRIDGRRLRLAMEAVVAAAPPPGRRRHIILTGFDVTAAGRLQDSLRQSKSQVRAIVETAVDAIITADQRGSIHTFNPAAERIFQFKPAEVIGHNVSMLMPEPYHSEHDRYLQNYLRTGRAKIIGIGREVVGRRKDGSTFPMYLAVGEQVHGQRHFFTAIIRDISERKRMENEILHISEREQQRIGQDLHDGLGQLLTGAALHAKALGGQLGRTSPEFSARMNRVIELINDGIAQSRELSRGLQPVADCQVFPTSIQDLAERTQTLFDIECSVRCQPLPPGISLSDATHLYRIIQESIHNAVRHGKARHIQISLKTLGRNLRLTVRDDGVGFPDVRGRGLGLHIMNYRAGAIGALLEIRSTPGRGVTVICSLSQPEVPVEKLPVEKGKMS